MGEDLEKSLSNSGLARDRIYSPIAASPALSPGGAPATAEAGRGVRSPLPAFQRRRRGSGQHGAANDGRQRSSIDLTDAWHTVGQHQAARQSGWQEGARPSSGPHRFDLKEWFFNWWQRLNRVRTDSEPLKAVTERSPAVILRDFGVWEAPDDEAAAKHYKKLAPHHDIFEVWGTRIDELQAFGMGHYLYLWLLRCVALLFTILAAVTGLPLLVVYAWGDFSTAETSVLERTQLGNLGPPFVELLPAQDSEGLWFQFPNDQNLSAFSETRDSDLELVRLYQGVTSEMPNVTAGRMSAWFERNMRTSVAHTAASTLDLIGALAFYAGTITISLVEIYLRRAADTNTVTIGDYSVRIDGFAGHSMPSNMSPGELQDYCSQFGAVEQVELAREDGALIRLARKRSKVLNALHRKTTLLKLQATIRAENGREVPEGLLNSVKQLQTQLMDITEEMKRQRISRDTTDVVAAFVTFRDEIGRLACLHHLRRMKVMLKKSSVEPLRSTCQLVASQAPEPSDVFYENLQFNARERWLRRMGVMVLQYGTLLAALMVLNLVVSLKQTTVNNSKQEIAKCQTMCTTLYSQDADRTFLGLPSEADKKQLKACADAGGVPEGCSENDPACFKCFCRSTLAQSQLLDATCRGFLGLYFFENGTQVTAVVFIIVINVLLVQLMQYLAEMEAHHTRTRADSSFAYKLFLAQFLNTSFTTMVANAYAPTAAAWLRGTLLEGRMFEGIHSDVTPSWFATVGASLVVTVALQLFMTLVKIGLKFLLHWWKLRSRERALSQRQLEQKYMGPRFELSVRYGILLNHVFSVMLFSSGLPLLYVIAAATFAARYLLEKAELLKLSIQPSPMGPYLQEMASKLLPGAAMVHLVFATWAYSFSWSAPTSSFLKHLRSAVRQVSALATSVNVINMNANSDTVAARLLQDNVDHLFVTFLILVFTYICRNGVQVWYPWALEITKILTGKDDYEELAKGLPTFQTAVRSRLLIGPASYAVQKNPLYEDVFEDSAALWDVGSLPARHAEGAKPKGPSLKEYYAAGAVKHAWEYGEDIDLNAVQRYIKKKKALRQYRRAAGLPQT